MKKSETTKHQPHILKTIGLIGCHNLHDPLTKCVKQQVGPEYELPYIYCHIDRRLFANEWDRVRETVLHSAYAFRFMSVSAIAFTAPELYEFAPRVAEKSGLPVIHLGDVIGQAIKNSGLRRIGFLNQESTSAENPVLARINKNTDAEIFLPENRFAKRVGHVIERIAQNPDYRYNSDDENDLFSAISSLHINNEIQGVVLDRPEFRSILNEAAKFRFRNDHLNNPDFQFFDGPELLVQAIVDFARS